MELPLPFIQFLHRFGNPGFIFQPCLHSSAPLVQYISMRSLPLKLGVFVVLLFAAVITTCLLWTPVKIRYYVSKLKSDNSKERIAGLKGLLDTGPKGIAALAGELSGGQKEAEFLEKCWKNPENLKDGKYDPVHIAILDNYAESVKLLLDNGSDINQKCIAERTPLNLAIEAGHEKIARLLIGRGANINALDNRWPSRTPLHSAVMSNSISIAELLFAKGADINVRNNYLETPLHLAVENECMEMAEFLIEKGADVNSGIDNGARTPMEIASGNFNREMARLLMRKGAKLSSRCGTLFVYSAEKGDKELVEMLLNNGIKVNHADDWGRTALHWASMRDCISVAQLLIEKGADINPINRDGQTPLDRALTSEIVSLLRAHGGKTAEELKKELEKAVNK